MKRFLTLFSYLFSAAGITLAFLGYELIGAGGGVLAFLPGAWATMTISRLPQITASFLGALTIGLNLDLLHTGFPLFSCILLLTSMELSLRLLFFTSLGYVRARWLEPLFFLSALGLYVTANLVTDIGWAGWAFPVPCLFLSGFSVMGGLGDVPDFKKGKAQATKAEEGTVAPDFCLNDHEGKPTRLSDFREKNVLLMFVRGDWCPSCHIMLRTFEKNRQKFADKNVMLLAVGPDNVEVNREMVVKLDLDYRLLADDKQEVIRTYGIYIQEGPNPMAKYEIGSPLPASFLIDKRGIVRCISRADRMADFVNPGRIFEAVASLN